MLGKRKKRKTGVQMVRDLTEKIVIKKNVYKNSLLKVICTAWIIICSVSICVGFYGFASRMNDISKRERNIEKLKTELANLESQFKEKQELKIKLTSDSLAIEALARSYGMSKKGEKIFYFQD